MKSYEGARSCENFAYEVPVSRIPAAAVAAGALMSICDALNFGKIGVFGKVARSLRKFAYAFCGRKNGPCLPSAARSPLLLYHMGARLSRGKTKKIGEVLPSPNLNETAVKSSSQGQPHLSAKSHSCKKSSHTSNSSSSTPSKASHSFTGEQPSISCIRQRP